MATFGNRRRRQDRYLLDVKVRTEARTRGRIRWLAAWGTALVVCAFTSYGLYRLLKSGADDLVFANPRFAIAQVAVETDGVLQPQQVMRFTGVQTGENIFLVDLREVQRNLELIPMIRRVEVRRELPQRLLIRLSERTAVARLQVASHQLKDEIFLVDRDGMVMKPIRLADGTLVQPQMPRVMPVLTGAGLADVRVGRVVESEQVQRALSLLDKLDQSGAGTMLEVEQIDLSKPRRLTLVTRQQMRVQFDVKDFRPQLRRVSAILNWAQQHQRQIASIDLTVSRGVPVSFVGDAPTTLNPTGSVNARLVSLRRPH